MSQLEAEPERVSPHDPAWDVIVTKTRVDSFNQEAMVETVSKLRGEGKKFIAFDLKNTRFLSLAAIQHIVTLAKEMRVEGGQVALVAPSEKTKRHFEIYGSLDGIQVFRGGASFPIAGTHEVKSPGMDNLNGPIF